VDHDTHRNLFAIGEFSRITGLTVKTLRFYHDERLLIPTFIDPQTNYRYYAADQIETARVISYLRGLDFPVSEIASILKSAGDEKRLLDAMERHKEVLVKRVRQLRQAVKSIDQFIAQERQATMMAQANFEVQEKVLSPMLIAGIRMNGRYSECGKGFAKLGRTFGRHISGHPLLLHYDTEYKEDDADFEACMPLKQGKAVDGISVRELPGGRCVSLVHQGPYDQLGHSYAKILKYVRDKDYTIATPTREVYLKGPGMIFKGNPKNYLTEIQMLIEA
jgi:DNA-binding transcriptional MerR regulator